MYLIKIKGAVFKEKHFHQSELLLAPRLKLILITYIIKCMLIPWMWI